MRYLLSFAFLLSFPCFADTEQEIAAVYRNEDEAHYNEVEHLKQQYANLQRRFIELYRQLEGTVEMKEQNLRSYLEEQLSSLSGKIETLSEKLVEVASQEVAAASRPQETFPPAPDLTCPQGPSIPYAYSKPVGALTKRSCEVWTEGSFIYWEALQDNMEVGVLTNQFDSGYIAHGEFIKAPTLYRPGFQLGMGFHLDHDSWHFFTKYTYFRSEAAGRTSIEPAADFPSNYNQIWPLVGSTEVLQDASFSSVFSSWNVNMDIGEAVLGRRYYMGTHLTCRPYAGVRGLFLRQKRLVEYTNDVPAITHTSVPSAQIHQNAHSWAVGPEMGLDLDWKMKSGLRLLTYLEGDLLYTRYGQIHNSDSGPGPNPATWISNTEKELGCVRGHIDMELGLACGIYANKERFYIDFSALYGFQVFFDQNMFHAWFNNVSDRMGLTTIGNLYIQGLTTAIEFHY